MNATMQVVGGSPAKADTKDRWWSVSAPDEADRAAVLAAIAAAGPDDGAELGRAMEGEREGDWEWAIGQAERIKVTLTRSVLTEEYTVDMATEVDDRRHRRMFEAAMAVLGVEVDGAGRIGAIQGGVCVYPKEVSNWVLM